MLGGAEIGNQALAFVEVEGDTFIIVVGDVFAHDHGGLADRQQAFLLRGDGHALVCVEVHHDGRIFAGGVDGRVDGEAGGIDHRVGFLDDVAVQIDFDEGGGGNLLEEVTIWVDQEMMLRARDPVGDMGEDHVVPAVEGRQTVQGGEIDPRFPFRFADRAADVDIRVAVGHLISPCLWNGL